MSTLAIAAMTLAAASALPQYSSQHGAALAYLVAIHDQQDPEPGTDIVYANQGFVTVYRAAPVCEAGDILRIRAQVESTNNSDVTQRCHIKLRAQGVRIGTTSSENSVRFGSSPPPGPAYQDSHHLMLWADAVYRVGAHGPVEIEAQYASYRWDSNPPLVIEGNGNGHLLVEHYRPYANPWRAASNAALALRGEQGSDAELVTNYPGDETLTAVYRVTVPSQVGDLIRLHGQATSCYGGTARELHNQSLYLDGSGPGLGSRIGTKSGENNIWAVQFLPMSSDAVYVVSPGTTLQPTFVLAVKGHFGNETGISQQGGHLHAYRYSPVASSISDQALALSDATDEVGPAASTALISNTGWQTVHSALRSMRFGECVRGTGYVQLQHPTDFQYGIHCSLRILVVDSAGNVVAQSSIAEKYSNVNLGVLPLREELWFTAAHAGTFRIIEQVKAVRGDGQDPIVTVVGGGTHLILEAWRRIR